MGAKAAATVFIWITYLIIVGMVARLGLFGLGLAFIVSLPLIAITGMMWGAFGNESDKQQKQAISEAEIEKRKRDRIDAVLRNLSDADLERLKERLADGTVNDENLYNELVGDDGELLDFSR
jgi:hypothetical protein